MKRAILGSIAAAAVAAMPLWAQEGDLFAKLDKNSDGVVTADEVEGDAKGLFERFLRRGDKDGDKKLTKEEFAAAQSESDAPRQPLGQGRGQFGSGAFNMREAFSRMDANKDGKLSKDEARGPLSESFDRFDANSDGTISEEELARMAGRRPDGAPGAPGRPGTRPVDPRRVFARLDEDKDGKLIKTELPPFDRENFARYDANSDGSVSEEEYVKAAPVIRPIPPPRPEGGVGNPPDARRWEEVFDETDANSDGKVAADEVPPMLRDRFRQFLERQGMETANKEQFGRFMVLAVQQSRPGLIVALDTDRDGELSASEIEAAKKALLTLDRNEDGKLTREEMFGSPDGPSRDRPGVGRPGEARPGDRPGEPRPGERRPGDGRPGLGRRLSPDEFQARLKEADANGDGKLTKDEAPPMLKEQFDRIDANSDGVLDEVELRQMIQRMRESGDRPQGRPEGRPDGPRPEGDRPDAPRG